MKNLSRQAHNFKDLHGLTFGRLSVITQAESDKHGFTKWLCECQCGRQKVIHASSLTKGLTTSCGCLRKSRRAPNFRDLTGQEFGRLMVLELATIGWNPNRTRVTKWKCVCECGVATVVTSGGLLSGKTRSCGWLQKEIIGDIARKHGFRGTAEYIAWKQMMSRCYNPRNLAFKNYGGRGILVDEQWHDFIKFIAYIGNKPDPRYSLERPDNSRGYGPGNAIWADSKTQGRNKRNNHLITINNITKPMSVWTEVRGLKSHTIYARLKLGWSEEDAVLTPIGAKRGSRS
mgnify:CR=1 FL=1